MSKKYRFPIIVEHDKDGYFAYCPDLQGCYTQGETYEEAMKNIREAIKGHIQDHLANGDPITTNKEFSFTALEIAV